MWRKEMGVTLCMGGDVVCTLCAPVQKLQLFSATELAQLACSAEIATRLGLYWICFIHHCPTCYPLTFPAPRVPPSLPLNPHP